MKKPRLELEVSDAGVDRIVVCVPAGADSAAFELLQRAIAGMGVLDEALRVPSLRPLEEAKTEAVKDGGAS